MKNRIATKTFFTFFIMLFINILNIYSKSNLNETNPPKGIIRGHITDAHQQSIVGASVFLSGTVRYAATDEQGNFEFRSLDTGVYTIVASLIGFQKQEKKVEIIDDKVQIIDFNLADLNLTLNELHITYRQPLRGNEHLAEVSELSVNATKKNEVIMLNRLDANLAMNTTRQIFGRTPGIQIWESDASGIQIGVAARGLSPNRSWEFNVRMNSYDITPDPMGYPEAYFTPPLEAVERVELIRGASSLAWGSQFGGLMNFVMRKPDAAKRFTFESQNTIGSNGLLSSFNYAGGIEGRTTYAAFYQKRVGDGWRNNNSFNTDHAHAELSFAISNKFRIGAELTYMNYLSQQPGGLTDSMFAADAQQSVRSRNWFSAPWLVPALTASYIFNKHTQLNIKTFGTIGDRNSIGYVGAISQKDPLKYRQIDRDYYRNWGSEARLLHSFQWLGQTQTFNTGLRHFDGNMQRQQLGRGDSTQSFNLNLQESQFPRDLTFRNQNFAAFVEQLLRINNRLILTAGARFERIQTHAEGRFNTVNGQVVALTPTTRTRQFGLFGAGIEYHLTKQSEFYSNISQAYRPVLYSDLVPPATTDVIDPNLKDAVGFNFDLGYRGKISNWLNFDVDYFYLDYANRIGTITQTQASGTKYQYRTNLGQSVSQGFEGYLEWAPITLFAPNAQIGQLSLFGSMSFINAKYVDFQTNTGNLQDKRVENAPQYIHRFGATYHKKGFSVTWQLSNVGAAFADASNTVLPNAAATTGIIPAYQVHDVSATWRFAQRYQLKTGVNNVTNEKYFTRRAGGYPGPGLLPADGRTWYFSLGVKL